MIALFVVISAIVPVKISLDKDYLMNSLWVEEIPELDMDSTPRYFMNRRASWRPVAPRYSGKA